MSVSRRGLFGLFGLFAGAVAAPYLPTAAPDYVVRSTFTAYPASSLSLADIVTETLRARSGAIADNLTRNNAIFAHYDGTPKASA